MMRSVFVIVTVILLVACGGAELDYWHTVKLDEEFTVEKLASVDSFRDYLELEERLFHELDTQVYARIPGGPEQTLNRYSSGSVADPRQHQPNWNRSIELVPDKPLGGALLLHGMSDSPYSLRTLGEALHRRGYQVLALRLPGHGTSPSGLLTIDWRDMAAAVALAMAHLSEQLEDKPIHIIGYSTGAPLALNYSLDALDGGSSLQPASLVLISPAIGISPVAALAGTKRRLSRLPGLGQLAWSGIDPEFDPYKYNSFATNAAEQVHRITREVGARIAARANVESTVPLPPILAFKSTVDATVSTNAVVDRLLMRLAPQRHELVLFDINRRALNTPLLIGNPAPFTGRLIKDDSLPFRLTLVSNRDAQGASVSARDKAPFSAALSQGETLGSAWPHGVVSLSHVALPFAPDDPLYGRFPPQAADQLFLGELPLRGERGLLRISSDWLLRLRYNPFYDYLEQRTLDWVSRY